MNTQCNDTRLIALLQSDDDESVRGIAEHVEPCTHCQSRIEVLAAEPREWQLARDVLASSQRVETNGNDMDYDDYHREWGARREGSTHWTEAMARSLLSPPSHPEMLGRIGRYDVERLIGSGGMGVVFKAYDTELNRPVAVKLLAPYLARVDRHGIGLLAKLARQQQSSMITSWRFTTSKQAMIRSNRRFW